ncbi:tRNA (adenosine(37)-N6)-threonylcarbamoyltransferase complex transferase subunit TsaD [Candidatus Uhrbacteria bacterium]|nr:tRNA (adenosine(37)-N6)-threonylcarbamoyltransferase complex transferase subunit TsaD [Candidatus Uhrbacteria bacterium]
MNNKSHTILAIETSCDETSVALLRVSGNKVEIRHHETATQIPIHARYGGVVPEVAARTHVAEVVSLLERAGIFLSKKLSTVDAIAVTRGPGLSTALRVGIEAARTLAFSTGKPLIGVNHLEGHLASSWLVPENRNQWKFPILALLVSGGHTELVLMKDFGKYRIIGRTRDDAAGEAFDKSAKLMGLAYPGGPLISKYAAQFEKTKQKSRFTLPRPMINDPSLDMSFSGLKTAVRQTWEGISNEERSNESIIAEMAWSIQDAICDVLVQKTQRAIQKHHPVAVTVVGGVSANKELQKRMAEMIQTQTNILFHVPAIGLHTDNAAMIAAAGSWRFSRNAFDRWQTIDAKPEWNL